MVGYRFPILQLHIWKFIGWMCNYDYFQEIPWFGLPKFSVDYDEVSI